MSSVKDLVLDMFDGRFSGDALITNNHGVNIGSLSCSLAKTESVLRGSNILYHEFEEMADRNVDKNGSGMAVAGVLINDVLHFYIVEFNSIITEFGDLTVNHCEVVINNIRPISVVLGEDGYWNITEEYNKYIEEKPKKNKAGKE